MVSTVTGVVATGNMDLAGIRGNVLDGNTAVMLGKITKVQFKEDK